MIMPFEDRLERIRKANPMDENKEGNLAYQGRLRGLAEKEIIETVVLNKWHSMVDRFEAVIQILEHLRVKSYHA